MGEYALVKRFYVVEPIERLRKVERIQSLSLVERSHLMRLVQYLERDRAEIMAKNPDPKHLPVPNEKSVQPQEENPAYILDIGNHNNYDTSGVIVDIAGLRK